MSVEERKSRGKGIGNLVLGRTVGESIVIGEGENRIEITYFKNLGRRIRLRIVAPKDMPIVRGENEGR